MKIKKDIAINWEQQNEIKLKNEKTNKYKILHKRHFLTFQIKIRTTG